MPQLKGKCPRSPNFGVLPTQCDTGCATRFLHGDQSSCLGFVVHHASNIVLLCFSMAEVSRDAAIQWCLKNAFELVELNPPVVDADASDNEGLLCISLLF